MATAPTFDDFFLAGRAEAAARRPELTFDEGDVSEMLAAAGAAMADHLTGYAAQAVRETFLDGAEADALTRLADDRYNIQRQAANAATGLVTFTRQAPGTTVGTIAAGTVVATQPAADGSQVQYTLDADLGWSSGVLSQSAPVTCTIAGAAGNGAAGTVTRVVTGGLFDTFTVTNAARMAGGTDQESDPDLRERCRGFTATLRRGTLAALEYGAKQVPGVASATAVEPGDGTVNLYVTDASGSASPTLTAAVVTEILNWRAGGVPVNVSAGSLYTLSPITLSLSTRAGVSSAAIAANIKAAIVAAVNRLKIGETCSATLIRTAAMNADAGILDVTVTSPVGNVVPAANQIIRTSLGAITVS